MTLARLLDTSSFTKKQNALLYMRKLISSMTLYDNIKKCLTLSSTFNKGFVSPIHTHTHKPFGNNTEITRISK